MCMGYGVTTRIATAPRADSSTWWREELPMDSMAVGGSIGKKDGTQQTPRNRRGNSTVELDRLCLPVASQSCIGE